MDPRAGDTGDVLLRIQWFLASRDDLVRPHFSSATVFRSRTVRLKWFFIFLFYNHLAELTSWHCQSEGVPQAPRYTPGPSENGAFPMAKERLYSSQNSAIGRS